MNIHFLQSDHGHFLIKKASYGHNLISLTYILGIYSRRHNSLGSFVCNPDFKGGNFGIANISLKTVVIV